MKNGFASDRHGDCTWTPVIEHLKVFNGQNGAQTIEEYIHTPQCPYDDIRGYGLQRRYITLDVPHLIVPTMKLARERGISTPIFDACYHLARPFLPTLANIDFSTERPWRHHGISGFHGS
jgi:hypothetical protein